MGGEFYRIVRAAIDNCITSPPEGRPRQHQAAAMGMLRCNICRMEQIEALQENGYVVVPRLVAPEAVSRLNETARTQLRARAAPLELEVDLRYPGAPKSPEDAGGATVRRLLDAY